MGPRTHFRAAAPTHPPCLVLPHQRPLTVCTPLTQEKKPVVAYRAANTPEEHLAGRPCNSKLSKLMAGEETKPLTPADEDTT